MWRRQVVSSGRKRRCLERELVRETEVITSCSQETEFTAFFSEDMVSSNLDKTPSLKTSLFVFICMHIDVCTHMCHAHTDSGRGHCTSQNCLMWVLEPEPLSHLPALQLLVLKGPDPLLIRHVGNQVFNTGTFERNSAYTSLSQALIFVTTLPLTYFPELLCANKETEAQMSTACWPSTHTLCSSDGAYTFTHKKLLQNTFCNYSCCYKIAFPEAHYSN